MSAPRSTQDCTAAASTHSALQSLWSSAEAISTARRAQQQLDTAALPPELILAAHARTADRAWRSASAAAPARSVVRLIEARLPLFTRARRACRCALW
mmetsp:Transcript_14823/g.45999  ORF Transcript_14823/g.45999 Transcript_14823/m.45999 type:complete len:98 (-) Transcript_14823:650-943(-)